MRIRVHTTEMWQDCENIAAWRIDSTGALVLYVKVEAELPRTGWQVAAVFAAGYWRFFTEIPAGA
jgi:hypothetical protein